MTMHITIRHVARALLLAGLALIVVALPARAQETDAASDDMGAAMETAADTAVEAPESVPAEAGVKDSARQTVRAVRDASTDMGSALRSGGQSAVAQGRKLWQEAMLPALQRMAAAVPGVLKALLLLLAFWIAGSIAGVCVRKLLNLTRIDDRAVRDWGLESLLKRPDGTLRSFAGMVGGVVKWVLLLFGFVAFFNALNLAMVAGPLQHVLDRIVGVVPSLLKATVILLLYWALAAVVRLAVTRLLGAVKFDERAGKHLAAAPDGKPAAGPSAMIGRLVFYVILLFGVPPFLQALGQQALVRPLQDMLSKALSFLPNVMGAAIIVVVGRIVASIVREVTGNFLAASGIDAGAGKLGLSKVLGSAKVSDIAAKLAYVFILVPIVVAAVDSLGIKVISDPIKATLQSILGAVPELLVATVIVIVGCVVAKVVRSLVETFLGGVGFDALPGRLGLDFLKPKAGQASLSGGVGAAVAVVIMLITAQQASATLHFDQLAALLRRFVEYLPNLVVGILILLAALSLGKYVGELVKNALGAQAHGHSLACVARYAIVLLGAGMALEQLGVGKEIVMIAVSAVLGGAALALGLAFGLGGQYRAKDTVERWSRDK
ncbi:MAG: mechanosensitive ion channel [Kiritimatiellae bacterium]|nr:mechanosensitive ion channel [Kiritimatiellia bacterium]